MSVVRSFCELRGIAGQRIVVAVSGGADSVALLRILADLRTDLGLEIVVAHFDHQLRTDSAEDAAWVCALGAELKLPCVIGRPESPARGSHVEAWARRERYRFLQQTARNANARWVAVGHTADDQAETVLHHVIRGTGLAGLAGMPETRMLCREVSICRPCLRASRQQLRETLRSGDHSWRDDPTNFDGRFTRNAIRNELLPFIEQRFGRDPVPALLKLAEQARLSMVDLRQRARRLLKRAVIEWDADRVRLSSRVLASASDLVVQEAAVLLWRRMDWSRREMSQRSWQRARQLMKGDARADQWPEFVRGACRREIVVLERTPPQPGAKPQTVAPADKGVEGDDGPGFA